MNRVVGQHADAPYVAFGDDSQIGSSLAYAFVIVKRERLSILLRRIDGLRRFFGFPDDEPIHSRVMFSGDQRNKRGLSHLTRQDVMAVVRKSVDVVNRTPCLLRYSTANLDEVSTAFTGGIELSDGGGQTQTVWSQPEPKGILGILAQSCFAVSVDGRDGPTADECEIFLSEDATRIRMLGTQRRRADRYATGFLETGDGVARLEPKKATVALQPALQLADTMAYLCSHAHTGRQQDLFFKLQLARVKHWSRGTFVT